MTRPIKRADGERPIVRQCTAHVPSGRRCRRSAVKGASVCPSHGGSAPQVRAAAAVRLAEAAAVATFERYAGPNGDSGAVNVVTELARLVAAVTAFRDFTEARLRAVTEAEWAAHGPRVAAQVRMFETACDQARRLLRDVARLGVVNAAERADYREAVNRSVGESVYRLFDRALRQMDLTPAQWETSRRVFPAELAAMAAEEAAGDG